MPVPADFLQDKKALMSVLFVFLIASYFCLWRIGAPVMDHHDETIHANVVLSMYETSDLFHPVLGGARYLNKPPFKMWLSTASLHLFGVSEFSFRFIDGVAGVGTVLLTYFFSLYLFRSYLSALLAALLLCSSKAFLFDHMVRHGTQDSMLVFLSTCAMFLLWRLHEKWTAKYSRCFFKESLLAGGIVGLAVLTKSVAGLFAASTFVLFSLGTLRLRIFEKHILASLCTIGSAILVLAIAWYLPQILTYENGLKNMLEISRLTSPPHGANQWDLYGAFLLSGDLIQRPLLALTLIFLGWAYYSERELRSAILLLLSWGLGLFIILTLLPSRVTHYLGPAYPAFAIAAGHALQMTLSLTINILRSKNISLRPLALIPLLLILLSFREIHDDLWRNHLRINTFPGAPKAHRLLELAKQEEEAHKGLTMYVFDDILRSRYDYMLYSRLHDTQYKEVGDEISLIEEASQEPHMLIMRRVRAKTFAGRMPELSCKTLYTGNKARFIKKRNFYIFYNFPLSQEYPFLKECDDIRNTSPNPHIQG